MHPLNDCACACPNLQIVRHVLVQALVLYRLSKAPPTPVPPPWTASPSRPKEQPLALAPLEPASPPSDSEHTAPMEPLTSSEDEGEIACVQEGDRQQGEFEGEGAQSRAASSQSHSPDGEGGSYSTHRANGAAQAPSEAVQGLGKEHTCGEEDSKDV